MNQLSAKFNALSTYQKVAVILGGIVVVFLGFKLLTRKKTTVGTLTGTVVPQSSAPTNAPVNTGGGTGGGGTAGNNTGNIQIDPQLPPNGDVIFKDNPPIDASRILYERGSNGLLYQVTGQGAKVANIGTSAAFTQKSAPSGGGGGAFDFVNLPNSDGFITKLPAGTRASTVDSYQVRGF